MACLNDERCSLRARCRRILTAGGGNTAEDRMSASGMLACLRRFGLTPEERAQPKALGRPCPRYLMKPIGKPMSKCSVVHGCTQDAADEHGCPSATPHMDVRKVLPKDMMARCSDMSRGTYWGGLTPPFACP